MRRIRSFETAGEQVKPILNRPSTKYDWATPKADICVQNRYVIRGDAG